MGRGGNEVNSKASSTFCFGQHDYPVQDIVVRSKPAWKQCDGVPSLEPPRAQQGDVFKQAVTGPFEHPSSWMSKPKCNNKSASPRTARVQKFHMKEEASALYGLKQNKENDFGEDALSALKMLRKSFKCQVKGPDPLQEEKARNEPMRIARYDSVGPNDEGPSHILSSCSTSRASTVDTRQAPAKVLLECAAVTSQSESEEILDKPASDCSEQLETSAGANLDSDAKDADSRVGTASASKLGESPRDEIQRTASLPVFPTPPRSASLAKLRLKELTQQAGQADESITNALKEVLNRAVVRKPPSRGRAIADGEEMSSRALRTKQREEARLQATGKLASEHFADGVAAQDAKVLWQKVQAAVKSGSIFEHFENELQKSENLVSQFYDQNATCPPSQPKKPPYRKRYGLQVPPALPSRTMPRHLKLKNIQAVPGKVEAKTEQQSKWYLPGIGAKTVVFTGKGQIEKVLEPPAASTKRRASQEAVDAQGDLSHVRAEADAAPMTPSVRKTRLRALRDLAADPEVDAPPLPRTPSPEPHNSRRYTGEWQDGLPHGTGRQLGQDGSWYEGEWQRGIIHGHGTFHFANGDVYCGDWHRGYRHGFGRSETTGGDGYEGSWHCGMQHGRGRHWKQSGEEYRGEWRNNVPHGQGSFRNKDGAQWDGVWKEGVVEWRGPLRLPAGTAPDTSQPLASPEPRQDWIGAIQCRESSAEANSECAGGPLSRESSAESNTAVKLPVLVPAARGQLPAHAASTLESCRLRSDS